MRSPAGSYDILFLHVSTKHHCTELYQTRTYSKQASSSIPPKTSAPLTHLFHRCGHFPSLWWSIPIVSLTSISNPSPAIIPSSSTPNSASWPTQSRHKSSTPTGQSDFRDVLARINRRRTPHQIWMRRRFRRRCCMMRRRWSRYCRRRFRDVGFGFRLVGRGSLLTYLVSIRESLTCSGQKEKLTRQRRRPNRLRTNTENHSELIDNHLCATEMIYAGEHVGALEFAPLHFMEI